MLGKPDPTTPTPIPYGAPIRAVARPHSRTVHGHQTNPEHREMRATTPHAGYLVLRLVSYPAWQHSRQRPAPAALPKRDDGLIAVPVPQGPVDLTVDWTTSPDVVAGRWLSAFSVLSAHQLCVWC